MCKRFFYIHKPHYQRESLLNGRNYFFGFVWLITCRHERKLSLDLALFRMRHLHSSGCHFVHSDKLKYIQMTWSGVFTAVFHVCIPSVERTLCFWCYLACTYFVGFVDLALGLHENDGELNVRCAKSSATQQVQIPRGVETIEGIIFSWLEIMSHSP